MNEKPLALYMGYAFSHAMHVQQLLAQNELMVPFVIYWNGNQPTATPYPASTQEEAVKKAIMAREQKKSSVSGWACGREGLVTQNDGTKLDALFFEGWVPGLDNPLEMFVYYQKSPFSLINGFIWKTHENARKDTRAFMIDFKNGIMSHSFGNKCMELIAQAKPFGGTK